MELEFSISPMFRVCVREGIRVLVEDIVNLVSNSSFCLDLELEFELGVDNIKGKFLNLTFIQPS